MRPQDRRNAVPNSRAGNFFGNRPAARRPENRRAGVARVLARRRTGVTHAPSFSLPTMTQPIERHEFQAEVKQLLDLMVHSLYSDKDIFLRELISNASDALDKLRFEQLTRTELSATDLHIRIDVDRAARTVSVSDNGIGMTRDEVVKNIGTIARSGTREFLSSVKDAQKDAQKDTQTASVPPELIGQ